MISHACIDMVPRGMPPLPSQFQLRELATQQVQNQILQGKLSSSRRRVIEDESFSKLKASFLTSLLWDTKTKTTLSIAFVDGTEQEKKWVESVVMKHIAPVCDKFTFLWNVPINDADIRISFKGTAAYSLIGKLSVQNVPNENHSMLLGWLDSDFESSDKVQKEMRGTGAVILHEFGHALGMIHEHQVPGAPFQWNKQNIMNTLKKNGINWDENMAETQILARYGSAKECASTTNLNAKAIYCSQVNGSVYDPTSIMHYFYPKEWVQPGPNTPSFTRNTQLSRLDKIWLSKHYKKEPFPEDATDEMIDLILKGHPDTSQTSETNTYETETNIDETDIDIVNSNIPVIVNYKNIQEANNMLRTEKQKLLDEQEKLKDTKQLIVEQKKHIEIRESTVEDKSQELETIQYQLTQKTIQTENLLKDIELEHQQMKEREQEESKRKQQERENAQYGLLFQYDQEMIMILFVQLLVYMILYYVCGKL